MGIFFFAAPEEETRWKFYCLSVPLTPVLLISPFSGSPLNPIIQLHSLNLLWVFGLFPLYCSLVYSLFFPDFLLQLSISPSLLFWPLSFPPSVLSPSSLLHHKLDGWVIHPSLCCDPYFIAQLNWRPSFLCSYRHSTSGADMENVQD